jgi:hypothetical protein
MNNNQTSRLAVLAILATSLLAVGIVTATSMTEEVDAAITQSNSATQSSGAGIAQSASATGSGGLSIAANIGIILQSNSATQVNSVTR